AAKRLLRPVDNFLNREVGAALFRDDRLCGIEKALNALLGAQLRGPDGTLHRALLPGRFFARARHCPDRPVSRGVDMGTLYRRVGRQRGVVLPLSVPNQDCCYQKKKPCSHPDMTDSVPERDKSECALVTESAAVLA